MTKRKPNLILFGIDSLRRDHMSLYGYRRLTTPHLDEYARGGVTFDNLFSPSIPTTPAYSLASRVTVAHLGPFELLLTLNLHEFHGKEVCMTFPAVSSPK